MQVGASLPDGRQFQLSSRFKYSLWSFRLKDFDLKHRTLSYCMLSMDLDVRQLYRSSLLMRYLWEQIRTAFKPSSQKLYDKFFDMLTRVTRTELEEFRRYAAQCYPNPPDTAPDLKTVEVVRKGYRHLLYLTDSSGFGNRLIKSYSDEQYQMKNMFE